MEFKCNFVRVEFSRNAIALTMKATGTLFWEATSNFASVFKILFKTHQGVVTIITRK